MTVDPRSILHRLDPYSWTRDKIRLKGQAWSFDQRDYLKEIYRDNSKHKVVVKGRQTEMTTTAANLVLHKLMNFPHRQALYCFPTGALCTDFYDLKITPITSQENIQREIGNIDSRTKVIFRNHSALVLKTTHAGGDKARGISADDLYLDEYQDIDEVYRHDEPDKLSRDVLLENISHSKDPRSVTWGTPKLKGSNFEALWESSSQKRWVIKCTNCGHGQYMTLRNIINFDEAYTQDNPDLAYYGCVKCSTEIEHRHHGEWVAFGDPRANLTGYHLPRLIVPWKSAADIMIDHGTQKLYKGKGVSTFYQEVLGEFFSGSAVPFSEENLALCYKTGETLWEASNQPTYLGVDWGDTSTAAIITYDKEKDLPTIVAAFKFAQPDMLDQVEEIATLFSRYNIKKAVFDSGYGKVQNFELNKKFPGRTFEAIYVYNSKRTEGLYYWNHANRSVNIEREKMITSIIDRTRKGHDAVGGLVIPRDNKARYLMGEYLQEMKNVVAVQRFNRTEYSKGGGGDHFLHALMYAIAAAEQDSGNYTGGASPIVISGSTSSVKSKNNQLRNSVRRGGRYMY